MIPKKDNSNKNNILRKEVKSVAITILMKQLDALFLKTYYGNMKDRSSCYWFLHTFYTPVTPMLGIWLQSFNAHKVITILTGCSDSILGNMALSK